MQRIDNVGWQTCVKQKSENVVAVMSGSLKSYFYFVCRTGAAANGLQQGVLFSALHFACTPCSASFSTLEFPIAKKLNETPNFFEISVNFLTFNFQL